MIEKDIPRLMIVTGDDNFAMELAMERYLERIRVERGGCVVEHFDQSNERIGEFLARAMTASLFQEIRAFCVLHAQELSVGDLEALDKTLDYEIPDVYIFISADVDKKGAAGTKEAKVAKALQLKKRGGDKSASIQNFTRPPDYKLAEWIMEQVPALFNRQIGKAEAEFLAGCAEYDLIYSELRKIDMALPPGARVDKKIIEEIVGATREMTVYELAAALGKRDLPAALQVIDSLFTNDFYAPLAVSAVFRHFWSLLKIKKYLEKNPSILKQYNTRGFGKDSPQSNAAFEIGRACGLLSDKEKARVYPVIIKSGVVEQSQSFTASELMNIIKALRRFDVDVKTGRTEPVQINLQLLCYGIIRAA